VEFTLPGSTFANGFPVATTHNVAALLPALRLLLPGWPTAFVAAKNVRISRIHMLANVFLPLLALLWRSAAATLLHRFMALLALFRRGAVATLLHGFLALLALFRRAVIQPLLHLRS
jgi:hypothetical protein